MRPFLMVTKVLQNGGRPGWGLRGPPAVRPKVEADARGHTEGVQRPYRAFKGPPISRYRGGFDPK